MHRLLEHTADIRLMVKAESLEELFRDSVRGLARAYLEIYDGDLPELEENTRLPIEIEAESLEELVHKLLREGVRLFDVQKALPFDFNLRAICYKEGIWNLRGEMIFADAPASEISAYIKAVTYHEYYLRQEFSYTVVLDV